MEQHEIKTHIKNIANRTERIEQILPRLATKKDLKAYPTRDEVKTMLEEEGERTRRHFDVVAEDMKASAEKIAEGHGVLGARIETARAT